VAVGEQGVGGSAHAIEWSADACPDQTG
jgi:hypothetical protein